MKIRSLRILVVLTCLSMPLLSARAQTNESPSVFNRTRTDYSKLTMNEKVRKFQSLAPEQKARVFMSLGVEDKMLVFTNVGDVEKDMIFRSLSEDAKREIFDKLGYEQKIALFKRASQPDKVLLFNALSRTEKREWLLRYPGLEFFVTPEEEAPPGLPAKPAEKAEEAPEISEIEKIMSGRFPSEIVRELRLYGYSFFEKGISAFTPVTNVPVGPDYVIGPGDSFTIHLWGKAEESYDVHVNRDGCIFVPRLGTMNVSGLTFSELKRYLERKFKQYYPAFDMSITMGRLRTVEIFIVGEARNPGTYSLSSLSTVITALFESGGPGKNGSLRDIRVFRNGEPVKRLDLYEFFIKGFKRDDIRLQQGDTLFIPVIGPVVGMAGYVRRPAIYEMKGPQTIQEMIEIAGGILPVGYLQNVVVERIERHKRRVIRSFNLDPASTAADENLKMPLKDGDVVKIYPVHERVRRVVYLEGHVKYPREYELKPGMRLRDIIPSYDALLPEPYLPRAEIIRLVKPDLHPEIIQFDLAGVLAGEQARNLLLQDLDRVVIYEKWQKRDIPEVTIKGEVRDPGTYRLYDGMKVKDLMFQAGNLTDKAYLEKGSLTRVVARDKGTDTIKLDFSPENAMAGLPSDNLSLQKDDVVYIREIPEYRDVLQRKVMLEGEFVFPGEYTFSEGERLSSVIERAGGLTEDAYSFGAVFQRESVKKIQAERMRDYVGKLEEDILTLSAQAAETALDKEEAAILRETLTVKKQLVEKLKTARPTGRMVINLPEVLILPSSEHNFELRPGDRLVVNKKPDSVNVLGEVYNPTALLFEREQTLGHYLNLVGGPTDNADKGQIYVVKANGSVFSKGQTRWFGMVTWDSRNYRWTLTGFDSMELDPGDTVIVPKKVIKYPWMRLTKDITTILYQIAVAAGVVIAAFD